MSSLMESVRELVSQAAEADAPVLFRGEHGTGKGLLARLLHARSARSGGPFVAVDCPTLTSDLIASELFGYARGAFTGALGTKPGRVEAASGGTLFLDEIAEVPLASQAKLLRFVQEKAFERVGDPRTRHADVRIVTATHHDLEADVRNGSFREDLFYCLNVIEIRVPALRERRDDIVLLAREILETVSAKAGHDAVDALLVGGERARELRLARERSRAAKRDRTRGDSLPRARRRCHRAPAAVDGGRSVVQADRRGRCSVLLPLFNVGAREDARREENRHAHGKGQGRYDHPGIRGAESRRSRICPSRCGALQLVHVEGTAFTAASAPVSRRTRTSNTSSSPPNRSLDACSPGLIANSCGRVTRIGLARLRRS